MDKQATLAECNAMLQAGMLEAAAQAGEQPAKPKRRATRSPDGKSAGADDAANAE